MAFPRKLLIPWIRIKSLLKGYGYKGDFPSWKEAEAHSTGYADPGIFDTLVRSARMARDGEAAYERDGVPFYDDAVSPELIAALEKAYTDPGANLRVVDFGGGLGSHYFQHRKWIESRNIPWLLIEQGAIVSIGKAEFEVGQLRFYDALEALPPFKGTTLFVFGCVLPYLEKPYAILDQVLSNRGDFLFIDKHPLISAKQDRLTVQVVPPSIYRASYPAWFFSTAKFHGYMKKQELLFEYECPEIVNIDAVFKGFFYRIA